MVLFGMRHEKRRKVLPGVRCKASGENDGALRKLRLGERRSRKNAKILPELRRAAVKRTSKKDVSMRYVFFGRSEIMFPANRKIASFRQKDDVRTFRSIHICRTIPRAGRRSWDS